MADAKICQDVEIYYKTICPYCEGVNWVSNGDPADETYPDLGAVECRSCGKKYWLVSPLEEGQDIEDVMCDRGKIVEEL